MILLYRLFSIIVQTLMTASKTAERHKHAEAAGKDSTDHPNEVHIVTLMAKRGTGPNWTDTREKETNQVTMDSDSYEMRIDTGASHCISYDRDDFTGRLTLTKGSIQGYHVTGAQSKLYIGTMRFKITDDDDKEHTFEVPNSIYDE